MASARTLADYADRLERVLVYLAGNLDADLDLDRLAEIACFSPFHFHRIYHALQGETVAETVRRMRLHRAAVDLLEGGVPIPRIASRAGYGSRAAFTRAFRSAYGAPPAAYCVGAAAAASGPRTVEVRATPPLRVLALRHQGDYGRIGLHHAYEWLYREWLAQSGEDAADRPCVEEYLNDARLVAPSELRTEVWLPLAGS